MSELQLRLDWSRYTS